MNKEKKNKSFFVRISISYHYTSDGEVFVGAENYSMKLYAESPKDAKTRAGLIAKELFEEEIGMKVSNVKVKVVDCHETSKPDDLDDGEDLGMSIISAYGVQ